MSLYGIFQSLTLRGSARAICACHQQRFSSKIPAKVVKQVDPVTGEVKRKKTNIIPKITLLSGDSISLATLEEAQNISKRRNLKLVKIIDVDAKTQRPVYKLMTGAEYHAEDLKQREKRKSDKQNVYIKGEKVVLINSRITQHDLETHLRKAVKWIEKMFEIRVVISGTSSSDADKIYTAFEQHFKNAQTEVKFVQKRMVGNEMKFQMLPPKKKTDTDSKL